MRGFLPILVALFIGSSSMPAGAQGAGHHALAEELFRDGKDSMQRGEIAAACRKLEESQRLDPGGGTLLVLAICHEREGKTATAWSEFQQSVSLARSSKRADRERVAAARIAALEPRLSRLTLESETPQDGLHVHLDGTAIGRAAWGTAMPVDPGTHRVSAGAPGRSPWSQSVVVGADGDSQVVRIPVLSVSRGAPPASGRTLGFALGGAGIVALGVGTFYGVRAFDKKAESEDGCSGGICDAVGFAAHESGKTAATVSTIAFGAGAALLGAGLYFVLSSREAAAEPTSARARAALTLGAGLRPAAEAAGGALTLHGAW